MTATVSARRRRPTIRRAVVLFPSGLTLGNLFFGVFAIITASRGDFQRAGIYVMLGGICDALDGRVARATNAGSEFGEQLDSLVDAIAFGLAPAMIMYFAVLNRGGWDWIFVFLFVACAVARLARFNVEQAGTTKTYFQGLPSPAAGITLASYYWFSQSWLYSYGAIGDLPWQEMMRFLMAGLGFLMISPIPYPVLPRTGFRSVRALGSSVLVFGSIALLLSKQLEYFFPLCIGYVVWGPVRNVFSLLFERRQPTIPYDLSEGEDDEEYEEETVKEASPVVTNRPSTRDPRGAREEREKPLRNRPDRGGSALAEDRDERPARGDRPERIERPARPARPARAARTDRPERTDAERAERAARRAKRDKREGRVESSGRPEQPADAASATEIGAVIVAQSPDATLVSAEALIGSIPGAANATPPVPAEGVAARKRKRRRRRGERKERSGSAASDIRADQDAGDDNAGGDSSSFEKNAGDDPSERSPYSAAPDSPPVPSPDTRVTPPPIPIQPPAPSSSEPSK